MLLTLVFSGAQVWSAGVLVDVIGSGIALFAFALVMSAALIAVLDAWREIWRFAAVSRTSVECGG
ncbi:hypothetical protein ABT337_09740 [Saccharopolyspora hirsuta]|uniref:hypothetical protein n=1 Tax=Saccharopolyspora hirsuta TaxID=1837 RepID=UPI00333278FB